MVRIEVLAAVITFLVASSSAQGRPITATANASLRTRPVQTAIQRDGRRESAERDPSLVVSASVSNPELQSESPVGGFSSGSKSSNQLAEKKLIGSWIDKDRNILWIFQADGIERSFDSGKGNPDVSWRINYETGELELLNRGSLMFGYVFSFDGSKLLLKGDGATIHLEKCNLPCGMALPPAQFHSGAAVDFRGIVIDVVHSPSGPSVNATSETGGTPAYILAGKSSVTERDSFGVTAKGLLPGDVIHAQCSDAGRQGNIVLLQCGTVERVVAHTPQQAASAYINAHITHCGESYYLQDYMGTTPMGIREYRGLHWSVQSLPTTGADRLNGITEKVRVTLSATANRQHGPHGGTWSEWMPGFSTMFSDPANLTGVGTHTQAFEMVHASGSWRLSGAGFELSNPQPCSQLLAIK
jgi:hypothetical protein